MSNNDNSILKFDATENRKYSYLIKKTDKNENKTSRTERLGFTAEGLKRRIDEAVNSDTRARPNIPEQQIIREREYLQKIADENEDFVVQDLPSSRLPETGEHNIRISEDCRFWKYTKGTQYGYVPFADTPNIHDFSNIKLSITPATPSQYLERVTLSNELFGDNIKLEGITKQGGIVISQTAVVGKPANRKQIAESLTIKGWERVDSSKTTLTGLLADTSWYNKAKGVVLVDARPANMLIDSKGIVYPIDVMLIKIGLLLRNLLDK